MLAHFFFEDSGLIHARCYIVMWEMGMLHWDSIIDTRTLCITNLIILLNKVLFRLFQEEINDSAPFLLFIKCFLSSSFEFFLWVIWDYIFLLVYLKWRVMRTIFDCSMISGKSLLWLSPMWTLKRPTPSLVLWSLICSKPAAIHVKCNFNLSEYKTHLFLTTIQS